MGRPMSMQSPRMEVLESRDCETSQLEQFVIEQTALMTEAVEELRNLQLQLAQQKKQQDETPAQRLGIVRRRLTLGDFLRTRLFATRVGLGPVLKQHYERRIPTRRIPSMKRHALEYAY